MKTTLSPKLSLIWNWIQEALTNIWRFLLGILLLIVALTILGIVAFVSLFVYLFSLRSEKKNIGEMLTENGSFNKMVSIGIDILGNIVGSKTFNKLFLKEILQFPFGIAGQRISSVIQWNFLLNNLSKYGMWLYVILEKLEKNHAKKSVDTEIKLAERMIQLNLEL